ncbi:MAG: AsmA-like C-terminal region-containing protein, partial [Xanthomonadales bacterium]|nr:AsmA-like C-terminal region-containing protein [Xanthomonadales bacterium]
DVPLRQGEGDVTLDGRLELEGNGFTAPEVGFSLAGIGGLVTYHEAGFEGDDIAAQYSGKPATLSIRAGDGAFTARLEGEFEATDVLPPRLLETWPPLADINGTSPWVAQMDAGAEREPRLTVMSGLEGIEIPLPEPLDKPPDEPWPLQFSVPLAGDSRLLELAIDDRFSMKMTFGDDWTAPRGASIRIGPEAAAPPDSGQFRLNGEASTLDLDGWIRLVIQQARAGRRLGGLQLDSGAVSARELLFLDRRFEEVGMQFSTSGDALGVTFSAETIDGRINFVGLGGGSQSISAELDRLVVGPPLSSGMELDVDPAQLPALHLYAGSFRYSGVELGETRIEAYPTAEGFHFEIVEAESEQMSVRASGDWALIEGSHRSNFDIHMTSESLGDFLRHLNFASPVEGGQTLVDFSVWWEGSPGQFRLARLNGEVNFNVNTGVIRDASPGTGRLLGLLSVQSLPKRLALDFRDVFDSGLVFDEASGSFIMLNGSARTDDVRLTSSAANISFSGTTDLVGRQYDQLITVRPGLGNTLPVIGAIAGGPGGAAAGLALQGLLHDELGEASQVQYTLTGDWDAPRIEPVIKARADG